MSLPGNQQTSRDFLLRAVRELAAAKRSAVIELDRAGHEGQILVVDGEVTAASAGRLSGTAAFQHLLLWTDATLRLRPASFSAKLRKIHEPVAALIRTGLAFVEEFELLSGWIGDPRSTFEIHVERDAAAARKLPVEVRRFADTIGSGATIIDLIEASPFRPFDTIKVCFRLCELGLMSRKDPQVAASPMRAQRAVLDWLRDATAPTPTPPPKRPEKKPEKRSAEQKTDRSARRPKIPPTGRNKRITGRTGPIEKTRPERGDPTEPTFDNVDKAFFAAEAALYGTQPVERFEDLENTATRAKLAKKRL